MIYRFIQKSSFVLFLLLFALPVMAVEQIDLFEASILINPDATLTVTETIHYNFDEGYKHGIYRDIPTKYKTREGNFNLRISHITVTDKQNRNLYFVTQSAGNDTQIKIGNKDEYVTGKKIYIISYTVTRAINQFDNHQELYWNIIGDTWVVPIEKTTVNVFTPDYINIIQTVCYAGSYGTDKNCDQLSAIDNYGDLIEIPKETNIGNKLYFSQGELFPGQVFTIVVGIPKDSLQLPTIWENLLWTLFDNKILFMPLFVFYFMFVRWKKYGKDPKGRIAIVPQYDPPEGLTPAEIGTVIDEKVGNRDITASIIDLAVQGYLKIDFTESATMFGKDDYTLTKLRPDNDLTTNFEQKLLKSIFGLHSTKKLSELVNSFYKKIPSIRKSIYTDAVANGFFIENPKKIRAKYVGGGFAIFLISLFILAILDYVPTIYETIAYIISNMTIILFGFIMPKRTLKGVLIQEHIKGFKNYLKTAEKERIKFHNAPERKPERFQKLLPYAIVLGVEKEWATQFKDIYMEQPSWYTGQDALSSIDIVSRVNTFTLLANSSMISQPSSASSGGSGFSGGGSSSGGGGFGGGGGGSW